MNTGQSTLGVVDSLLSKQGKGVILYQGNKKCNYFIKDFPGFAVGDKVSFVVVGNRASNIVKNDD
jgi:hypothetical protein